MPDFVTCPCQHCNAKIEFDPVTLSEENKKITCPHCSLETFLFLPPPPASHMETALSGKRKLAPLPTWTEADRLRGVANRFASASRVIFLLSLILPVTWAFLAGVFGNSEGFWSLSVVVSGVGLSLWLYLTAQVIYIRAALEKKRG